MVFYFIKTTESFSLFLNYFFFFKKIRTIQLSDKKIKRELSEADRQEIHMGSISYVP